VDRSITKHGNSRLRAALGVPPAALVRVLETELELPLLGEVVRVLGFPEHGIEDVRDVVVSQVNV
jgi:hypothetical protein